MAVTLRETRRPKGRPAKQRALTAASQLITDPQRQMKSSMLTGTGRAGWQSEAWDFYETIGELAYYVSWRSNSCSRCALIASEIDPDTGLPTGGLETDEDGKIVDPDSQRVADWVKTIAGGPLGQATIVKRMVECLSVVGEAHLAVLVRTDPILQLPVVKWYVLTRDEIKVRTAESAELELPDGSKHEYNPATDSLIRVWIPRARRAREATSPVKACLEPLREIARTSKKIKHAAKSRLMNNGVLLLPEEMSMPGAGAPLAGDQINVPGAPLPTEMLGGAAAAEQLAVRLLQASVASMEDDNAASSFIPQLVTAKGDYIKYVKHINFASDVTEVEIKTRTDSIKRLAMGLDVSPERLLGMSTGNHWSAWQIEDSDVQLHIKPVMDLFCNSVYSELMSRMLLKDGIDPSKYTLTFDATGLTADPDLTDEAFKAHESGSITSAHLRRLVNLGEDSGYDLTTLEGCQEYARDVVAKDPTLFKDFLPLLALEVTELDALDFPEPVAISPADTTDEEDPSGAETQSEPTTEDTSAGAGIMHRAEYILAERLLVNRALERANKRRVKTNDHTQRAKLAGIPATEWHRYLPPAGEADVTRALHDVDAALENEAILMLGVSTEPLRDAARRIIRRELTRPQVDAEVV